MAKVTIGAEMSPYKRFLYSSSAERDTTAANSTASRLEWSTEYQTLRQLTQSMPLKAAIVALTGLWCLSISASPFQPGDIRALLSQKANGWDKGTIISFPQSSTFVNITSRWSTYDPPTYLAAVSLATETDVAKVVRDQKLEDTREY